MDQPIKKPRGFQLLSAEQRRAIASSGGIASHKSGKAHQWTSEEARAAGLKGANRRFPTGQNNPGGGEV